MSTRTLAVTGKFDDDGGRPSSIGNKLATTLNWPHINGGNLEILRTIDPQLYDTILWMPEISNDDGPKILPRLKTGNRKLTLISSKRCRDKYTDSDVIGRLLKTHSNLGIAIHSPREFTPPLTHRYHFHLLDPLGNIWANTTEIPELVEAIIRRLDDLQTIRRCSSRRAGPEHPFEVNPTFLATVRRFGQEFATHVNAINPNRYLGNAATRCAHGFPAERREETVLVSRRNIPKTTIASSDFVEVIGSHQHENILSYWGQHKPSIDAPIQVMLFRHFEHIKFIIHGHTYAAGPSGAPITQHKYPCGDMQEFHAITKLVDKNAEQFVVNLRGHGCLIACKDLNFYNTIQLKARPFPEQ